MRRRHLTVWLLAAALALTTAGCGGNTVSARDGEVYVEGLLSASYLGQVEEDYQRMMDYSQRELQQVWDTSLESEGAFFFQYFGLDEPLEASVTAAAEVYREIYQKASFRVISGAKQSDGSISVKVEIQPLNTIRLLLERESETIDTLLTVYPEPDWLDETGKAAYAQTLVDALSRVAGESTTLGTETHLVELTANSEGSYSMSSRYFDLLDSRIIDYPQRED